MPCRGVRGSLVVDRPRRRRPGPVVDSVRLADSIEQIGRAERAEAIPPDTFWSAACRWLDGEQLDHLASAAELRGLRRWAAVLRRHAVVSADRPAGAAGLVLTVAEVDPGRLDDVAAWLVEHAPAIRAFDVMRFYEALQSHGRPTLAHDVVAALLNRMRLDDLEATVDLLEELHDNGHDDLVSDLRVRGIVAGAESVDTLLAARAR
jgi:hypothetical protein